MRVGRGVHGVEKQLLKYLSHIKIIRGSGAFMFCSMGIRSWLERFLSLAGLEHGVARSVGQATDHLL